MNNNEEIQQTLSHVKSLLGKHQLLETLVQRQNRVEVQKVLEQLAPGPIARILEDLSADDRQIIWQLVPDAKKRENPSGDQIPSAWSCCLR
jgi:Mg/Co/Ni transporter MgtE